MRDAVDEIIAIHKRDDATLGDMDSGYLTRAWVYRQLEAFRQTAEEHLAGLHQIDAELAASDGKALRPSGPYSTHLDMMLSGPVDGASYAGMKDSTWYKELERQEQQAEAAQHVDSP